MIEIQVKVTPTVVGTFDVRLCLCIRESKPLYVRITGTVEKPWINVEKVSIGEYTHKTTKATALSSKIHKNTTMINCTKCITKLFKQGYQVSEKPGS